MLTVIDITIVTRTTSTWKEENSKVDAEPAKLIEFVGCVVFLLEELVLEPPEVGLPFVLFVADDPGEIPGTGLIVDGIEVDDGFVVDEVGKGATGVVVIFAFSAALMDSDCAHQAFEFACSVRSCNCN